MAIERGELDNMTDANALRFLANHAPKLPMDVRRRLRDIADELEDLAAQAAELRQRRQRKRGGGGGGGPFSEMFS